MDVEWSNRYPSQGVLRDEVRCMSESFVEVLLDEIPPQEIRGLYFKGSAQKQWESLLDYVPEVSDVDIHIYFSEDAAVQRHLGTIAKAMRIQARVEKTYFSKTRKPLHTPRPQLVVLNDLRHQPDYIPTPTSAITVLHGEDYPQGDYGGPDRIRQVDCRRLIEDGAYLARFPFHLVDRPGRYLWESIRTFVWRVSPIGPRVLHILGVKTEDAWSLNRTRIVSRLEELGELQLAEEYAGFYLAAWDYFLSGYSDTDAGRLSIGCGVRALIKAVEIAEEFLIPGCSPDD